MSYVKSKIYDDHRKIYPRYADPEADWKKDVVVGCAQVALFCLKDKKDRPTMPAVCRALDKLRAASSSQRDGVGPNGVE
jgi:hypothetical protein